MTFTQFALSSTKIVLSPMRGECAGPTGLEHPKIASGVNRF
jgi:hypothetical protein